MNRRVFVVSALALVLASIGPSATNAAAPFSEIVVFGDSVSDTGNVFLASAGTIAGPPYFEGRFSNGPVWVEVLAERLGLQAPGPSLLGGSNYAWGGAESGEGLSSFDTPNVGLQIDFFLNDRGGFTGHELIVVGVGANDLSWDDPIPPAQIVENIATQIRRLAAAGGRTVMVANLPRYGQSPLLRGTPDEADFNSDVADFNRLLKRELQRLRKDLVITILPLDTNRLIDRMLRNPKRFGLSNVTSPACPGGGIGIPDRDAGDTVVPNPDEHMWWDFIHFTRVVHEAIGELAAKVVDGDDD
jgi:phospholipase/lecithinase/hemolysin